MTETRFSMALSRGLFDLPDGPLAVVNAAGETDLSFAEPGQLRLSQSFFPDYNALQLRGYAVDVTPKAPVAASLILAHRAKPASLDLIARAAHLTQAGGLIAVEGPKTDGIESLLKAAKAKFGELEVYAKSHGKLFWLTRPDPLPDLSEWQAAPREIEGGFTTYPGVFSADAIDKGSSLLAAHLPPLQGDGIDLGAGWGFLSRHILKSAAVRTLDLVEADHYALEAARLNVQDARARFAWADATQQAGRTYDFVVSNPPFHVGRQATPGLGQSFIAKAAQLSAKKGQFWMVANRNLPYEDTLGAHFAQVDTVAQTAGFKVICARRPRDGAQTTRAPR